MILKKRIISSVLFLTLVMMPVSGIVIHKMHGTIAGHKWLHIHVLFGVIFMIAGIFHIVYNWRIMKHHMIGRK